MSTNWSMMQKSVKVSSASQRRPDEIEMLKLWQKQQDDTDAEEAQTSLLRELAPDFLVL